MSKRLKGVSRPDAPRLRAYLARIESHRVLQMPRLDWQKLKPRGRRKVLIDVHSMPFRAVAQDAAVIAVTAERLAPSVSEVCVYRSDPRDAKPYNVDKYSLEEQLAGRPDFEEIVAAASTTVDANMLAYLDETVILVSRDAGSSHWLDEDELPAVVRIALSRASLGAG